MIAVLTGLVVLALTFLWWCVITSQRPSTCPKGHPTHYLTPTGWRCSTCATESERRKHRRYAKERREAARRDRG